MRKTLFTFLVFSSNILISQTKFFEIPYSDNKGEYASEVCKVNISSNASEGSQPIIEWFHGGGLTSGKNHIPNTLSNSKNVVMSVEYRKYPRVKVVDILDDAAQAVSWAIDHGTQYGGDTSKIFVAGHSAGGYLATMIALDSTYLSKYGKTPKDLAGVVSYSGHTITHLTERKSRGISPLDVVVDSLAPIYHTRSDAPPMVLISGDREQELYGRYEELAYFWRMMKLRGDEDILLYELEGFGHSGMTNPGHHILLNFIEKTTK